MNEARPSEQLQALQLLPHLLLPMLMILPMLRFQEPREQARSPVQLGMAMQARQGLYRTVPVQSVARLLEQKAAQILRSLG
jgi:hypothetical protein